MAMSRLVGSVLLRLMWPSSGVATLLRGTTIMHRRLGLLLRWLPVEVRNAIRVCWRALRLIVVSSVVFGMTILASSRLRYVWDDLHSAWNNTCGSSTSSSIC